jgi:hypothetical protein
MAKEKQPKGRPGNKSEELLKKALEAIEKYKLVFIEELVAYLPCTKTTLYDHFPAGSDGHKSMIEAIEKNKINIKTSMRAKWYQSEAPQLQIALMKILGTEEELRRLSMTKSENKTELTGELKVQTITGMEIV